VGLDDGLDDGQAETDTVLTTVSGRWSAVVRLEQTLGFVYRDTGTSIGDEHPNGVATTGD
jgi:hypothetical protein